MSRVLPILFNADMVRAILDGRKTVTRLIVKPQPKMKLCYTFAAGYKKDIGKWDYPSKTTHEHWGEEYKHPDSLTEADLKMKWNPPYHANDILYVRETWSEGYVEGTYIYRADDKLAELAEFKESSKMIYRPSIHMPKEAARIWLKVTDVRVEILQDITEYQIVAEGTPYDKEEYAGWERGDIVTHNAETYLRGCFMRLWNSTIKKSDLDRYGWDANPWVWVIEFGRCEKPEGEDIE